ncbi:hypothetical protein [Pseudoalteromonas luteoviolacea]|uniref:Uncharacterized protein n=1 Tax=Pseudoalteromonas luteoviolacea H33 TaxID=1365251 RepID=A0A167E460_9GAMM|nr:hypothetical protein [Pseudoalteromonas luteoviolacea]KZN50020.1 hypothetical protein N476_16875 [Pseudoalteromonas luteoviolacea H33]KZN76406.1 hypothetical protein N477_17010 [Pseudoalteromonas luteoviolacea H33-S]
MASEMPKKKETDRRHIEAGLSVLTSLKGDAGNRVLFRQVYGREPDSQSELNTFSNRLQPGRGNPGLDFLGKFVEAYPELAKMSLGEFFRVKE